MQKFIILKYASTANGGDHTVRATKKTLKIKISLIGVCLRHLSSVSNSEKKTQYHHFLKYDSYAIITAYTLESAFRRVIGFKIKGSIAFQ